MDERVSAFFNRIKEKKIAFIGCGRSNLPLTKLFARYGAHVIVCDAKDESNFSAAADELRSIGIRIRCGRDYLNKLDADIVFRTPGMYFNKPEMELTHNGN